MLTAKDEKIVEQAIQYDAIDLDSLQRESESKKRTQILAEHKYAISPPKQDGFWRTYVPDSTKKQHRRMIKKKTKESLEDAIVEFYEQQKDPKIMTMEDLYPEWLHYYSLHVGAAGTVNYVICEWKKFYKDDPIVKIPLTELTKVQLDTWVHEQLATYHFKKKAYYNMSLIVRQMLKYALDCGYIDEDPFEDVHVDSKLFRKEKKPASETQVYTLEEEIAIVDEAWKDFKSDPSVTTPLAVVLSFYLGIRPGEVVAFKESEIEGNKIQVDSMERRSYQWISETEMKQSGREVVDHAKTAAGTRDIYLIGEARAVIETIMKVNRDNDCEEGSYLFMVNGERIDDNAVRWRLEKYCNKLGILYRSPNKIRKTFISTLIDAGMNIDAIREIAGHEDERTTYGNYCFNRKTEDQTNQEMEDALSIAVNQNISENEETYDNVIPFRPKQP